MNAINQNLVRDFAAMARMSSSWIEYTGPRKGRGWKNSVTSEIRYVEDMPGDDSPDSGESGVESNYMRDADWHYKNGTIPEGWFVHGRFGRKDLDTGRVTQLTRDWDVARQYAGKQGSMWMIRPRESARVIDLSNESTARQIAEKMLDAYRDGTLPGGLDEIVRIALEEYDSDTVIDQLVKSIAPESIVESAGFFDDEDFPYWLWDSLGFDFAITPDGAVVLDKTEIESEMVGGSLSVNPLLAHHGSPHTFDKLKTEYIGTGVGVAAFGWGLYFSSRKDFAQHFRDKYRGALIDGIFVSDIPRPPMTIADAKHRLGRDGKEVTGDSVEALLRDSRVAADEYDIAKVIDQLKTRDAVVDRLKRSPDLLAVHDSMEKSGRLKYRLGSLYEVDIPEESEMLNFDSPASGSVMEKIGRMIPEYRQDPRRNILRVGDAMVPSSGNEKLTGSDVYNLLKMKYGSAEAASKALKAAGVPGSVYKDNGVKNYVVFDESDVSIRNRMSAWVEYAGPRKGKGWKHQSTGEVRYIESQPQDDPVGGVVTESSVTRMSSSEWTRYKGRRGGQGWQNQVTKEVRYQEDQPFDVSSDVDQTGLRADLLRAFHGSPHQFEKFTTEKIGTGEGEQVFGWGLYFTDKQDIAEHYRMVLGRNRWAIDGKVIDMPTWSDLEEMPDSDHTPEVYAAKAMQSVVGPILELALAADGKSKNHKEFRNRESARRAMEMIRDGRVVSPTGAIYEVDLAPEEDEYILWDRPLSEQSEKVKQALNVYKKNGAFGKITGEQLYQSLSDGTGHAYPRGQKSASEYLKSIGIRGIKYMDGSSRNSGDPVQQSYNYVIFDDTDVSIVNRMSAWI